MSITEIFAIAFGLFLGYWVVSKLIGSQSDSGQEKKENYSNGGSSRASNESADQEWFEVLKVSKNASVDEIQAAYKTLIRQYHPDKVATLGEELQALAEEKSKAINAAYQAGLSARGR